MAEIFNFPKKQSAQQAKSRAVGSMSAPVLQVGSRGTAVADVQARLKFLGYSVSVDRVYGLETQKAVTKFQVDTDGLTVTGVVDGTTWVKLDGAAKAKGFVEQTFTPPTPTTPNFDTHWSAPPLVNAPPTQPQQQVPFFQSDFGKKSIVVLGGIAGIALLAYVVKGGEAKAAMSGYTRFVTDVSSNIRNSERPMGPPRSRTPRARKAGTATSTRKSCSRTPASKMLVDAEVLTPEG